jgi:hypothetical protein
MATLIQLSETFWLNLDLVADVHHHDGTWTLRVVGLPEPLRLTWTEAQAFVWYLERHGQRGGYNQMRLRSGQPATPRGDEPWIVGTSSNS